MKLAAAARLFASQALWRTTGLPSAGRALMRALGSDDEDLRTTAGMFLVQAGEQAEPLLEEALHKREHLPMVLRIIGDIGAWRFESELRAFGQDTDPQVARAAQDALRVLEAHRRRESEVRSPKSEV
jgi:hypothetical protein